MDLREKLSPFCSTFDRFGTHAADADWGLSVTASGRLQLLLRPTTQFVLNKLNAQSAWLTGTRPIAACEVEAKDRLAAELARPHLILMR